MCLCLSVCVCACVCLRPTLYQSLMSEISDFANLKKTAYGRTDGRTDGPTDRPSYRGARTHLKTNAYTVCSNIAAVFYPIYSAAKYNFSDNNDICFFRRSWIFTVRSLLVVVLVEPCLVQLSSDHQKYVCDQRIGSLCSSKHQCAWINIRHKIRLCQKCEKWTNILQRLQLAEDTKFFAVVFFDRSCYFTRLVYER